MMLQHAIGAVTALALLCSAGLCQTTIRRCPVEAGPSRIPQLTLLGLDPGGMINDGWDGSGANPTALAFHMEGFTPDLGANQRTMILAALQAWANQAKVTFVEIPLPNQQRSFDFDFLSGNHANVEPQETASSCAFDGTFGTIAHAGFPPGGASLCVNPMAESWAGNVHFDEAETWEQGDIPLVGDSRFDLLSTAVHEIGHALGLVHSEFPGDIMFATTTDDSVFNGLSANDIANIQSGYEAGQGAVLTLPDLGIWVDSSNAGLMFGSSIFPFQALSSAASGLPPLAPSVPIYVQAGTYDETSLVFDRAATLEPLGGSIVIL